MDLKKLPPSMLVLLGLGCPGVQACLSPPIDSTESSSSGVEPSTVGPCLSPPLDSSGSEVGPCLSPPEETFGTSTSTSTSTGTGTGTGTDSGTGTDTGTGSGTGTDSGTDSGSGTDGGSTFGPCLAPPPIEPDDTPEGLQSLASPAPSARSRRDALARVLGVLPPDVAARLLGEPID